MKALNSPLAGVFRWLAFTCSSLVMVDIVPCNPASLVHAGRHDFAATLARPPPSNGEAKLAFELGAAVRELRERHGWSQAQLAHAAGMTQSAVARFEAGGTVPTLPILERLAHALDVRLAVQFTPKTAAA
jgi:ribosome-binding protein aMBF1 (putative translation factor)